MTISQGGFVNRDGGEVWFEKYPSLKSGDLVGHVDAAVALRGWYGHTGDQQSKAAFDWAVNALENRLVMFEVPTTSGGVTGAADLMRGYGAAPLRIVATGRVAEINSVTLNGKPAPVPLVGASSSSSGTPTYPLMVAAGQVQQLVVDGAGSFVLQANVGGSWKQVEAFNLAYTKDPVTVPEHLTGRLSNAAVTAEVVAALDEMAFRSGHTVFSLYANHWN